MTDQLSISVEEQKAGYDAHVRAVLSAEVTKRKNAIETAHDKLAESERILEEFDAARRMETVVTAEYAEVVDEDVPEPPPVVNGITVLTCKTCGGAKSTFDEHGDEITCPECKGRGWNPPVEQKVIANGEVVDMDTGEVASLVDEMLAEQDAEAGDGLPEPDSDYGFDDENEALSIPDPEDVQFEDSVSSDTGGEDA